MFLGLSEKLVSLNNMMLNAVDQKSLNLMFVAHGQRGMERQLVWGNRSETSEM